MLMRALQSIACQAFTLAYWRQVQDDVTAAEDWGAEAIREAVDNEAGTVGTPHLAELITKLTAGKKTLSQVTTGIHLVFKSEVQPLH